MPKNRSSRPECRGDFPDKTIIGEPVDLNGLLFVCTKRKVAGYELNGNALSAVTGVITERQPRRWIWRRCTLIRLGAQFIRKELKVKASMWKHYDDLLGTDIAGLRQIVLSHIKPTLHETSSCLSDINAQFFRLK